MCYSHFGNGVRIGAIFITQWGQLNIPVPLRIFISNCCFFFNFQNDQSKKPGEGANPFNRGITSTEPISWEEYAQKTIRQRKEKEMASTKDISIKVA